MTYGHDGAATVMPQISRHPFILHFVPEATSTRWVVRTAGPPLLKVARRWPGEGGSDLLQGIPPLGPWGRLPQLLLVLVYALRRPLFLFLGQDQQLTESGIIRNPVYDVPDLLRTVMNQLQLVS